MKRYFLAALILMIGGVLFATRPIAQQPQTGAAPSPAQAAGTELATFAAGCFWCTESDFDKVEGVVSTVSGYIGGKTKNPTYKQVSSGRTGHTEAVEIRYDPSKVTYQQLLDVYWRNVDPVDGEGQFCDRGSQYRPGIFYHNAEQKRLAEASKMTIETSGRLDRPIAVEITQASEFTAAEAYHQDYHNKESLRYKIYRYGCGRDARLDAVWGDKPVKTN